MLMLLAADTLNKQLRIATHLTQPKRSTRLAIGAPNSRFGLNITPSQATDEFGKKG